MSGRHLRLSMASGITDKYEFVVTRGAKRRRTEKSSGLDPGPDEIAVLTQLKQRKAIPCSGSILWVTIQFFVAQKESSARREEQRAQLMVQRSHSDQQAAVSGYLMEVSMIL